LGNEVEVVFKFVSFSHTVAYPRAVMIVHGYTSIAFFTVFTSQRLFDMANSAVLHLYKEVYRIILLTQFTINFAFYLNSFRLDARLLLSFNFSLLISSEVCLVQRRNIAHARENITLANTRV
jgi:uncharacterized membrane protein